MKSTIFHLPSAMKKLFSHWPSSRWSVPLTHLSGKSAMLLLIALLVLVSTPLLAQNTPEDETTQNETMQTAQMQTAQMQAVEELAAQSNGRTLITFNKGSGVATFMRLPADLELAAVNRNAEPAAIAQTFLGQYGSVFGIRDANAELVLNDTGVDRLGMNHLTYVQRYQGIPVFAGELKVHIDPNGSVRVVNGDFVPNINVDVNPTRTVVDAAAIAVEAVLAPRGFQPENISTDVGMVNSKLYIFHTGLLRRVAGQAHLVYEIEVANSTRSIREFVYVDAHTGKIVERISGIHEHGRAQNPPPPTITPTPTPPPLTPPPPTPPVPPTITPAPPAPVPGGLYRQIYQLLFSPDTVIWSEGDPLPYDGPDSGEVNNLINYAEDTYNAYATLSDGAFVSWDGEDARMHSVLLDQFGFVCPNAYWDSTSTNFCPGVTGDDTVAHEWAHGYTESTNNLIYAWQPGALNESYSDIFGEVVDLLNGSGLDTPDEPRSADGCSIYGADPSGTDDSYRWLSGEDDPGFGGAIRDMWNPNCYRHPAKVSDDLYWCATGDSGGVHINSGVPNHAFALLVDGGEYNGQSVEPIGLTKAAHLHWRAATEYLVPATNFIEYADALEASCTDLVDLGGELPGISTETDVPFGSGVSMTATDCGELAKVIEAVELRVEPVQCEFEALLKPDAPALCLDAGQVRTISLADWENGLGEWVSDSRDVQDPAYFPPNWEIVTNLPENRAGSATYVVNNTEYGNCSTEDATGVRYLESPVITLPNNVYIPRITVDHLMGVEARYDGGNIKVSVNGGPWEIVPESSFTFNPYNDELLSSSFFQTNTNPMAGEIAFSGADEGQVRGSWGQSQLNLFGIAEAGDDVQIRIEFGQDGCFGLDGWYVDDVRLYSCSGEFAGSSCGNYKIDVGESCDDGNTASGDGCSNLCVVENGFVCSPPTPAQESGNVLLDGSFELGSPNPHWAEESSAFESPLLLYNGTSMGIPTDDGDWIAIFGYTGLAESASLEQSVEIPDTATTIDFALWKAYCDPTSGSDQVRLMIDGLEAYATNLPCTPESTYRTQSIDVSAYADNAEHTVRFEVDIANNFGSIFVLDNVMLGDNVPAGPIGSICEIEQAKIEATPGTLSADLQVNGTENSGFTIRNPGNSTLYWDIATDPIGQARLPQRPTSFVPTEQTAQLSSASKYSAQDGDSSNAEVDKSLFIKNPEWINPLVQSRLNAQTKSVSNAQTIGTTTLTHSFEQEILPRNSGYCAQGSNRYLRVFNLRDFGLSSTFGVTEVEIGIERGPSNRDLGVNLYTLGETLVYDEMTLVASATQTISQTRLGIVSVPIEGDFAPDEVLVVEVVMPDGGIPTIIGSNDQGQTAPTYVAAPACQVPEPVDAVTIGDEDMHVVMNVIGNVGDDYVACMNPAALPWLSVSPESGSTERGGSQFVATSFSANGLDAGLYEGSLCINSNAVDTPIMTIPVSMTVQPEELLYFSLNEWGSVGGYTFTDEDILSYDPRGSSGIYPIFDASDVGLTGNDLNAFTILDNGDMLMSFNFARLIPDVGWVTDTDIVRFIPTSIGANTAGSFELYLDGSEFGLESIGEDIDAIGFTPEGQLVISTLGSHRVPSANGDLNGHDEDLLVFDDGTGTWSLYWDGTSAGLDAITEDLWGVSIAGSIPVLDTKTKVYLTTSGDYAMESVTDPEEPIGELTGDGNDIILCASEAGVDECTFKPYWDGDLHGLADLSIDAFAVSGRLPDYRAESDPGQGGAAQRPSLPTANQELQFAQLGVDEVNDGDLDDDIGADVDDTLKNSSNEQNLDSRQLMPIMPVAP